MVWQSSTDHAIGVWCFTVLMPGGMLERSDVDLLLLLDGTVDVMQEMDRAQDVKWPLALEAGYTVSLIPVSVDDYLRSHEPYLWNARKEGFSVS